VFERGRARSVRTPRKKIKRGAAEPAANFYQGRLVTPDYTALERQESQTGESHLTKKARLQGKETEVDLARSAGGLGRGGYRGRHLTKRRRPLQSQVSSDQPIKACGGPGICKSHDG